MFWRNTLCTYRWWWYVTLTVCIHYVPVLGHNVYITSLQMPKIELHRPGIDPGPPAWQAGTLPKELSTLYEKLTENSASLTGCNTVYLRQYSVLFTFVSTLFTFASTVFFFVSTVLNFISIVFFFKSYVTIAPPHPPASIHVYLHYSGRGRGSPATNQPPPPEYLLYRLHTAILNRPLSSAATKEV
jgi:hypothetical protein